MIYIDALQFLLIIFGIICIGFIAYDLVGGWDLLNESLSRISNVKETLFNVGESYNAYLSVPGTIKTVEIIKGSSSYNGIWTSSMILTFTIAISGIVMSPSFSMLVFSSKEVTPFASQQAWFSGLLMGFILIFFTLAIGVGAVFLGANNVISESGNNISNVLPENIFPDNLDTLIPHLINLIGEYSPIFFSLLVICAIASFQSTSNFYLSMTYKKQIRLGMVGGGIDANIGEAHRFAARLDNRYNLLAGSLSSTPERSKTSGQAIGLDPDRIYDNFTDMAEKESSRKDGIEAVAIVTPNNVHACLLYTSDAADE